MELKVGKDKDDDKRLLIDVAEIKSNIRHNRDIVDILKSDYEEATTNKEKRVIGIEINSINNDIKSLRGKLREAALDSIFDAQKLETEIRTIRGELAVYSNIDQSEVNDVLKNFSGRYYEMYDARSDTERKLETAVGGDERNLQGELDVLNAAILQVGIVFRTEMIEGLLPDAKGIYSVDDVAEYAKAFFEIERESWFDNGDIKDDSMKIIKYGKPASVRYEPVHGSDELEEVREARILGVLEQNIEDRKHAISNVGGVWTTIGETDTKKGTPISFGSDELIKLSKIETPDEMISRINDRCTTMQRYAFASAIGIVDKDGSIIDKDGNIVGKTGNAIGNADEYGNVSDNKGNIIGKIDKDGKIVDEYGNTIFKEEIIVGKVDEYGNVSDNEGNIVGKVDVVCDVSESEIHEAFNRMKELEYGVSGSGHEYMQLFLKAMFKYGAFEDDVFDELASYDRSSDLLNRIEEEIRSCSCTITDTHKEEVEAAFDDRQAIERDSKGKGAVFMNRALRNIFSCDTFENHVYKKLSEYEDPTILIDKINTRLSDVGVYDKNVLKHAISGVNRKATLNKEDAKQQLDDVFGDHFTKDEYAEVAKHVTDEDAVVEHNISSLSSIFKNIGNEREGVGKEGQIRAGKILEGITNEEYNERWDKERRKMTKHGETKNIDAIIARRQLEAAQKQFDMLLRGIPDESMLLTDEVRYVFESVGLQDYVVNKLVAGVTDIEYAVDDNLKKLSIGMKSLIEKHDMYEDDIFSESMVYHAIDKSEKMNLGDHEGALAHMKASILGSVGKLDMTNYGNSITNAISEKIKTDYGYIDEKSLMDIPEDDITKQLSRRIQKYKDDANTIMRSAEETAIMDLYSGVSEEEDVHVPEEFSREEMQAKHDKKLDKARREAMEVSVALAIPDRLEPFISIAEIDDYTSAIPKKPKKLATEKGRRDMKWWESFMAKNEPLFERTPAFNKAKLALAMRKGAGDKYVVFGEGGESVGFSNLTKLDNWFKSHYGE